MQEEPSHRAFAPYAPEVVAGVSLTVAVPLLIGLLLEPTILGLPLLSGPLLLVPGLVLVVAGVFVGVAGVVTLAREVGPSLSGSPPRLCNVGPYAYVRNPGYLGGVLVAIGLAGVLYSPGTLILQASSGPGFTLSSFGWRTPVDEKVRRGVRGLLSTRRSLVSPRPEALSG